MAKRKADGTGAATDPHATSILIPPKKLGDLLKACRSIGEQTGELTGSLREKIGYAKEKQGLHTGAFAVIRRLDKMEAERGAEFMFHLNDMLEKAGLRERFEAVERLPMETKDEAGGEPSKVSNLAKKRAERQELAAAE